ncbi:MAG: 4Fe-4S binding protein [Acidobacteria bacterium]|nr:4Fe-4S binding protein [Acidobacteriota bacterium]
MFKLKNWKEIPIGGTIDMPGSALENKTGSWRVDRPVWDGSKCISCFRCWVYCPDMSIIVEDGKVRGINYDYCKGCGICAHECPEKVRALSMQREK